jgi:predicted DsbA family dithiol-disulfide isomerase
METLKLTIYSDYVCPWCYVGQGAVQKLSQNYPLEVTWMPFYLRPDTPPGRYGAAGSCKGAHEGDANPLGSNGESCWFEDDLPRSNPEHTFST